MNKIQKQALRKGTEIAVYEIKDVLNSNSSEIAYRAWNEHLNTTVILKEFFPSDYVERDTDDQSVQEKSKKDIAVFEYGLNNFIQENEKLLGIQHPGVQCAHNVLEFNHTAYFAVDDEQGTLLSEQLEMSKSFNEEELRVVLTSLLNALQNMHEAGIVHGDINPNNILIRKNNEPVLINFAGARQGFAKHVKMHSFELCQGYASPEQYVKGDHTGAAIDLYGLGATLYRCITKSDPEDARNRRSDLDDKKVDSQKSILKQTDSNFSEEFLQTIDWMLQPDVKQRPQSVSEVLTELNKNDQNLKEAEVTNSVKIETQDKNYEDSESKAGRMGLVVLLAGLIGFVAAGSAFIWYLQKNQINLDANLPEQEKQISAASVEQESGSSVAGTPARQSASKPKQKKHTLRKVPEVASAKFSDKASVKSVAQEEVAAKVEVITDKPSLSEKLSETDSSKPAIPALKSSEEDHAALVESRKKDELKAEISTSVKSAAQEEVASQDEVVTDVSEQNPDDSVQSEKETSAAAEKNADLIKKHLVSAEQKFAGFRLTTPSEDNAYSHYQAVLKIEPNHKGARKGLRRIVDLYILLIDKAIQSNRLKLAQAYLSRAKSVLPKSPYLKKKSEELVAIEQSLQDVDEIEN